jgi:UDP-glucose 4-epimerase
MRTIVTGAAGFIGSHVAEVLVEQGHEVVGLDDLSGGFVENVPPGVRFEKCSIQDPLDRLFQSVRPQAVYHLAAYAAEGLSHHIPRFNYENNVVGAVNVLGAAYRAGARHFVFTSSIAAYGHPASEEPFDESTPCHPCDPYGVAKLACEHHLAAVHDYYQRPTYTVFRPHNVFGPRQNVADPYRNVVGIFMRCALEGKPLPIFGDGTQTRSFSYIRTVARCIAEAPSVPAARNAVFNVGGDEAMSVHELARQICRVMDLPLRIEWQPPRKEVMHAHCRHDRVRAAFPEAYRDAIDIAGGLRLMADYVRARPIPPATEAPSAIEIADQLPPSWQRRLPGKS